MNAASADYTFNLGYAYWEEQDYPAAVYWLREAVRRQPADADAHFVLAAALKATNAATEADRERELARTTVGRIRRRGRGSGRAGTKTPGAGSRVPRARLAPRGPIRC